MPNISPSSRAPESRLRPPAAVPRASVASSSALLRSPWPVLVLLRLFLLFLFLHLLLLAFFLVFLATLVSHACSFSAIMMRIPVNVITESGKVITES
jgi:hypothetical protein